MKFSIIPTLLISSASLTFAQQCVDMDFSIRFMIPYPPGTEGSIRKSCQWISRVKYRAPNLAQSRCAIAGVEGFPKLTVADYCPLSCLVCGCEDTTEFFLIPNPPGTQGSMKKQCEWVTRVKDSKPGLWQERCNISEVAVNCPNACNACNALNAPSATPTKSGSPTISRAPTTSPQPTDSHQPSLSPTTSPMPTDLPSPSPSSQPSPSPTPGPTPSPTASPTSSPTGSPSSQPTTSPTPTPTSPPTASPSASPSATPTFPPTERPSPSPSVSPTSQPTISLEPSSSPTLSLSPTISEAPTKSPTPTISIPPTANPTTCEDTDFSIRFMVPNPPGTEGSKRKSCLWVNRLKDTQPNLIWNRCSISGVEGVIGFTVADMCPLSCATCGPCQNYQGRFLIPNPPGVEGSIRKTCQWITRVRNSKPLLWAERCQIGIVQDKCPAACELC